jgi:hypothetical protein
MSDRWKYQVKFGVFWGVFMTAFNILFEIKEISFSEQISKPDLYLRFVVHTGLGLFLVGYFNWKSQAKNEDKQ